MRVPCVIAILALVMTCLPVLGAQPKDTPNVFKDSVITREERVLGLVTIYSNVKQHFAYPDQLTKLDWDKVFVEYLPLVEKDQSLFDYYRTLQRFTSLLEDGHTDVSFPSSVQQAVDLLPLRLGIAEDKWVVIERMPSEEIIKDDIPPGSVVLSIDGLPPSEYYERKFVPILPLKTPQGKLHGILTRAVYPKDTKVRFEFQYPDGSVHARTLRANRGSIKWNPDLGRKYLLPYHRGDKFVSTTLPGDILYVRYAMCNSDCAEQFAKLIEGAKDRWPKGLIIDLRGNPGGGTPMNAVQHLIDKPIPWDQLRTRWSISYIDANLQMSGQDEQAQDQAMKMYISNYSLPKGMSRKWFQPSAGSIRPAKVHYDGPVVFLADGDTASAAEHFIVLLHGVKRAVLVGEPTYGSCGMPISKRLPGGGAVRVVTTNGKYADGREYNRVGCRPDIAVKRTIKGIAEGRDEFLDAAQAFLARRMAQEN